MIAVLLLKRCKEQLESREKKRYAVFLAPTVHLVVQQGRVLSTHTEYKIGTYYGDKGVDTWNVTKWKEETDAHQVLVMTPQVFLDALNTSALKMEMVEVLIFDECHHAQKKHPYALIMKIHYHSPQLVLKPKIFGMTASPVVGKASTSFGCASRMQQLESILDSKLYTLGDAERSELERYAPTPDHIVKTYMKTTCSRSAVGEELNVLLDKHMWLCDVSCTEPEDIFKVTEKVPKSITALHRTIDHCLVELGILGASIAVDTLLNMEKKQRPFHFGSNSSDDVLNAVEGRRKQFLHEVSQLLRPYLKESTDFEDHRLAKDQGLITPKLELLIDMLADHRNTENLRCIVFVERVIVCIVLARLIAQFDVLHGFMRCDYVAGTNADLCSKTTNQQQQTLNNFSEGKVNLLVATSVAEEGLDVQSCSMVIRFDICPTARSHIQSRGRARRHGSQYFWLIERGNNCEEEQLVHVIESEKAMKQEAVSRLNTDSQRQAPPAGDLEIFRVESGASRSTEDSVAFIHRYCAKLPGDRYCNPKPLFSFKETGTGFACTIKFPPNAPLGLVEGPNKHTEHLSKRAACLVACQRLYEIGAVRSDTLCPDFSTQEEEAEEIKIPGAGTNKLKELHPSVKPGAFRGSWLSSSGPVTLQLHVISFTIHPPEADEYSRFALLCERVLLDTFEVELHLTGKRVAKAKLASLDQVTIDWNELNAAKAYHEFLFNAAFNRFSFHTKDTSAKKPYWSETEQYLLLPLNDDNSIDWTSVSSTADASRRFFDPSTAEAKTSSKIQLGDHILQTASGPESISKLEDSVVITTHSGKIFCITGILQDLSGDSPFPGKQLGGRLSYTDYFKNHYDKTLNFPSQPLLEAKQTHAFHNLLSPRPGRGTNGWSRVELPPELCLVLGLKSSVIRSLYFLPSFMFRLTSAVCAKEFHSTLTKTHHILPTSQVLQALTSKECQEGFSYEGLEFLGDSFLKYAVAKKCFLTLSDKHEGELTKRRSLATCNATLSEIAKQHGFPAYIRNEMFEPAFWVAPGMYVPHASVCQHDLSAQLLSTGDEAGRTCIEGHRWIRSKISADVVEALVGAYLVTAGSSGALSFMSFLGIQAEVEQPLVDLARQRSQPVDARDRDCIQFLEKKLGYEFQNKALLLEAVTHASYPSGNICYQRLEFLGDSALDFLISQHLYDSNPGLAPGFLTDLRSAAVNNTYFARVAGKLELYPYLRHGSAALHEDVTCFINALKAQPDGSRLHAFEGTSGPKVLADMVESIAGAILVDTGFCLQQLWQVMLPLLSPIVTPDTVAFPPVKELHELCSFHKFGYWESYEASSNQGLTTAQICVAIGDKELAETAEQKTKKAAKKEAAEKMLATLHRHGYKHRRVK